MATDPYSSPTLNELFRIEQERGRLKNREVVEEATPLDSPLHPHFNWDDTECGQKYREMQAGQLIRSYRFTVDAGEETYRVRTFVSVPTDDGGRGYVQTSKAMADRRTSDVILQEALRAINQVRHKYKGLTNFGEVLRQSMRDNGEEGLGETG